nr:cupin domain-containing protein [uncultured Pseudogulbenkiania sp.]
MTDRAVVPKRITLFADPAVEPSVDYPRPDRLVAGNPRRLTWSHFENPTGEVSAGIWSCEKGAWRIAFAEHKDEFFAMIEGHVRLHEADGQVVDVRAGEAAVIPAGFAGVFEVVEPVRKYFVVVERNASHT